MQEIGTGAICGRFSRLAVLPFRVFCRGIRSNAFYNCNTFAKAIPISFISVVFTIPSFFIILT